jgi:acetylglutamate kinase
MKLVIRISNTDLAGAAESPEFARAIAQLLAEKHLIVIVHGRNRALLQPFPEIDRLSEAVPEQLLIASKLQDLELMAVSKLNKTFVAMLGTMGIPSFGLCGGDGNLVRTWRRTAKYPPSVAKQTYEIEVASVNPFWLDVIAKSGGLPVLANVALGPDRQYHSVSADQLSAECAIAWKADALVFLTREEGIKNQDGHVMRWLDAKKVVDPLFSSALPSNLLSKLNACSHVLKHGVKRARILPLSRSESLACFYFSRIEFGTEVILGS